MKIALVISALLSAVLTTPTPLEVRNERRREAGALISSWSSLSVAPGLQSRDQSPNTSEIGLALLILAAITPK